MRYPRPTALTRRPAVLLGSLTLGLALTLTACGNDEPASDTSAQVSETDHNDADVQFATDMIQHHAQALSMVDLTVDRTLDPEVQQLADDIREAQGPEIEVRRQLGPVTGRPGRGHHRVRQLHVPDRGRQVHPRHAHSRA